MSTITAVLLDLDGVVRHFDPSHRPTVERRHGLAPDTLESIAFASPLIDELVTGAITRAEWTRRIGEAIGNRAASEEWLSARGTVDDELIQVVEDLRRRGTTVAILTNGTDTIPDELADLGITGRFDAVFNSATIGFAKPDRRAFQYVCEALAVEPTAVFFTDDTESKLAGAIELGMTARRYRHVAGFIEDLDDLGLSSR